MALSIQIRILKSQDTTSVCLSQYCLELGRGGEGRGGEGRGGEGHSRDPNCYRSAYDAKSAYLIFYGYGRKVFDNRPKDFCPSL